MNGKPYVPKTTSLGYHSCMVTATVCYNITGFINLFIDHGFYNSGSDFVRKALKEQVKRDIDKFIKECPPYADRYQTCGTGGLY